MVRLRSGHLRPGVIVDVKRIGDLDSGIAQVGQVLRIGARCTMTDLLASPRVRASFPALIEAAAVVGSVQIRNRATLAGNLCNASPAADTAPALLAYGAVVNTIGIGGERHLPMSEFFKGPGRTALGPAELVTSIDVPLPDAPLGAAFKRLTRRRGVDLAILSVCCTVSRAGDVRVALGAVAPTPLLVTGISSRRHETAAGDRSPASPHRRARSPTCARPATTAPRCCRSSSSGRWRSRCSASTGTRPGTARLAERRSPVNRAWRFSG